MPPLRHSGQLYCLDKQSHRQESRVNVHSQKYKECMHMCVCVCIYEIHTYTILYFGIIIVVIHLDDLFKRVCIGYVVFSKTNKLKHKYYRYTK